MKFFLAVATTAFWLTLCVPAQAQDDAAEAKRLSASANLRPIAASPVSSEIRVWRTETLVSPAEGWVITSDKIVFYSGRGPALRPTAIFRTLKAGDILRAFNRMSRYNGQRLSCSRMKDGWGLVVEGVGPSKPFVFSASTPNLCTAGGARDVWLAYSSLIDATGQAL